LYKTLANTLFIGQNLVFVPECHSTNDLALQLCQQSSSPEGTVVITDNQTKGRGQRGNTWQTDVGKNFTFSLILKPTFLAIQDQFYLNIFTSLAIVDYLKTHASKALQVKWPNDIMADGKKICGILIENQIRGTSFEQTIVGIGLNVNQKTFSMSTPTSLAILTEKEYNLFTELEILLKKIEIRYLQLREGKLSLLKEDYLRAMYWSGEKHTFSDHQEIFEGTIEGIDHSGKLMLNVRGSSRSFAMKEISYMY
jgi:BirA family biotin operon repressor/biotin-[acetyl-CoA-carboxylase] ligase